MAEREGDPGALAPVGHHGAMAQAEPPGGLSAILVRRATPTRQWQLFLDHHAALLLPVSGELPFPDGLDLGGEATFRRMWEAQMPQNGLPLVGLPALTVSTGLVGAVPVGVQLVAGRDREDLCLLAGEAIEAGGVPPSPVDPA